MKPNSISESVEYCGLRLNTKSKEAIFGIRTASVKATAFRVLALLTQRAGDIVTRKELLQCVWGYDFDPGTKIIEVQLSYLRKVLAALKCRLRLKSVRGVGIRLMA
ncbi:TPA: winged helix-turn-helix transcriptional regulator [Pseudomonas putida]|nr:winged helix-turn-helix transcriptional regulator [Pseudomonas putida]